MANITAKEVAVKDIQDDLQKNGLNLIQFIDELNPIMDSLVEDQIARQQKISYCLSSWTF